MSVMDRDQRRPSFWKMCVSDRSLVSTIIIINVSNVPVYLFVCLTLCFTVGHFYIHVRYYLIFPYNQRYGDTI